MKNRILPLLMLVCLALSLSCTAFAAPLDTDADASLTLHYQKEGTPFPDLQIGIYRIAAAWRDGSFALLDPYASYPIDIHGITEQSQWTTVASTLNAYIVADQIRPYRETKTDETGTAQFTGIQTGLYFVREAIAEKADGTYIFNHFLVYVPTPLPDGTYEYAVEANPKCTEFIPKTHYTVTKLWQDEGNETARPKEVTVEIYKDGKLQETQILSAANNWSYAWTVFGEDQGRWVVVERNVAEQYKVTILQNGSAFSLINTWETDPDNPPPTGDSFNPLLWVMILCISGAVLVILGLHSRRRV